MTKAEAHNSSAWAGYSGTLRAILDEYARAIRDLDTVVRPITQDHYLAETTLSDKVFANLSTIMGHVIGAGHNYVDYLEDACSGIDRGRRLHNYSQATPHEAMASVWEAFDRMVAVLGQNREWGEDELEKAQFTTRWNQRYDAEQMLEHAIVHILRHRRQIERWLAAPVVE